MDLSAPLEKLIRIRSDQKKALKKLGILTGLDLLRHLPTRYNNSSENSLIRDLKPGDKATIYGNLKKLQTKKSFRSRVPMAEGIIEDGSGSIKALWFHQPYIAKMYQEGSPIEATGTISEQNNKLTIINPKLSPLTTEPSVPGKLDFSASADNTATLLPIYKESKGVSSLWISHAVQRLFAMEAFQNLIDPIPPDIRKQYHLPSLQTAYIWAHTPKRVKDYRSARKRFAFEEIFLIQLRQQKERAQYAKQPSFQLKKKYSDLADFIERWPFRPTGAQTKAIKSILTDMRSQGAMTRLLEGDVGSGKTAVAAACVYAVTTTPPIDNKHAHLQTAYMAPTEILAKQQFANFIHFFDHLGIEIGLITSSGAWKYPSKIDPTQPTKISKPQLLKWIKDGQIPIVVGTHSLIQKKVEFKNLGLIIIDEQHRFGTAQRRNLARKDDIAPHLLSMTATPIPRTLALTIYGDLDLTILDEMPPGRKLVKTTLVDTKDKRAQMYEHLHSELKKGYQVYVICPRIDEPDPNKRYAIRAKAVKTEALRLQKDEFPDYTVTALHGQQKPAEKEAIMADFEKGKIDVLVSTSVVEVGVNVPNATNIVIEGAERFGLAQLHQLRGRVVRSSQQAHCFVMSESKTEKTRQRLQALTTSKNGFELAEHDLTFRGAGDLAGRKQSGLSDLAMEAIRNIKLVEAARETSRQLLAQDPELKTQPELLKKITTDQTDIHFE